MNDSDDEDKKGEVLDDEAKDLDAIDINNLDKAAIVKEGKEF